MHDIYEPLDPPYRKPIPLEQAGDRIGTEAIPCDPRKIIAIVPCRCILIQQDLWLLSMMMQRQ